LAGIPSSWLGLSGNLRPSATTVASMVRPGYFSSKKPSRNASYRLRRAGMPP